MATSTINYVISEKIARGLCPGLVALRGQVDQADLFLELLHHWPKQYNRSQHKFQKVI